MRKSPKAKYHAGAAVRNRITGFRLANCYSDVYKAEKIHISLSATKRQNFETTDDFTRKKEAGRPHVYSLKCNLLKSRGRVCSLQKLQKNSRKDLRKADTLFLKNLIPSGSAENCSDESQSELYGDDLERSSKTR